MASTKSAASEATARRTKMTKSTEAHRTKSKNQKTQAQKTKNTSQGKIKHKPSNNETVGANPRKSPRLAGPNFVQVQDMGKNKNNSCNQNSWKKVKDSNDLSSQTPKKTKDSHKDCTSTTPSTSGIRNLMVCLTPLTPRSQQRHGVRPKCRTPATNRVKSSIVPKTPNSGEKMKQPTLSQFMTSMRNSPSAKQRIIPEDNNAEPIDLSKDAGSVEDVVMIDDIVTTNAQIGNNNTEEGPLDLRKQTTPKHLLKRSALDGVVSMDVSPVSSTNKENSVDMIKHASGSPNTLASMVNWASVRDKITPTKISPQRNLTGTLRRESFSPSRLAPVETLRREITPTNSPMERLKPIRREATPTTNSDSDSSVSSMVRGSNSKRGRPRKTSTEPSFTELARVAKQGAKIKAKENRARRDTCIEPVESPLKLNEPMLKGLPESQTATNSILATRNATIEPDQVTEQGSMDADTEVPNNDQVNKVTSQVTKYSLREGMQFPW